MRDHFLVSHNLQYITSRVNSFRSYHLAGKQLFIFSWRFCFQVYVHSIIFHWEVVEILLIIGRSLWSSNSFSRTSTTFWYSSGKFNMMWVTIYKSSMCSSGFCRSPLSSFISAIHYFGYFGMSFSLHFASLLRNFVLEALLVGPNFLEIFPHTFLASPYLLGFVSANSTIWKQTVHSCPSIISL